MTFYKFKKTDSGVYGKALEMTIKEALKKKKIAVSSHNSADVIYNHKHYEIKSNGGVFQYDDNAKPVKNASAVIYTTHVSYIEQAIDNDYIGVAIDLANTSLYCVDRADFIEYLTTTKGMLKPCNDRGNVNIQSLYNYKKKEYIGKKGVNFERWLYENENDENDIIGAILEGLE